MVVGGQGPSVAVGVEEKTSVLIQRPVIKGVSAMVLKIILIFLGCCILIGAGVYYVKRKL